MKTRRRFPGLEARAPEGAAEAIVALLHEAGTTGIEEPESGRLRAWFAEPPPTQLLARLRACGARSVVRFSTPEADWVAMGRRAVRAVRVPPFLVRPPWSRARPRRGEVGIVIDPARAFGTANHESTRLALRALAARLRPGARVLDVGCGSGVLALAALRLGASRAVGCDIDPEAIAGARDNAARNGLSARLLLVAGGAERVTGRFDLVLANLTASILLEAAAALADRTRPGGFAVASGFLVADRAAVAGGLQAAGLRVVEAVSEGEWAALVAGRERPR